MTLSKQIWDWFPGMMMGGGGVNSFYNLRLVLLNDFKMNEWNDLVRFKSAEIIFLLTFVVEAVMIFITASKVLFLNQSLHIRHKLCMTHKPSRCSPRSSRAVPLGSRRNPIQTSSVLPPHHNGPNIHRNDHVPQRCWTSSLNVLAVYRTVTAWCMLLNCRDTNQS